ncbi:LEC14B protein-like [Camellia sinensis]|uniref:LEC14B protein-like n=1 Tax=Camellia sinensis TaxID=4442 RepID=UPI001036435F|nr:LEC14B protein-like [Camellia sinensis]
MLFSLQKNILAKSLRWTITDTSLSPDQCYLVYASTSPIVHIVNVGSAATESHANITEIHDGLDFSDDDGGYSFGIFSVKFSTDGRELVAVAVITQYMFMALNQISFPFKFWHTRELESLMAMHLHFVREKPMQVSREATKRGFSAADCMFLDIQMWICFC